MSSGSMPVASKPVRTVAVLGAGIVGLTTAYALRQRGFKVEVLDAAAGPGQGTSAGNGAQLSYSYVTPFASPAALAEIPNMLLGRGAVRLRLHASPAQWVWLARFAAACTSSRVRDTIAELLTLAEESRAGMDAFLARYNLGFDHRRTGKLILYRSQAALDAARREAALKQELGSRPVVLDWEGCLDVEPALAGTRNSYAGGVFTSTDETGNCAAFCAGLAEQLQADGVRFKWNRRIQGVHAGADGRPLLAISGDDTAADAIVACLGVGAASALGLASRVQPMGGCSLSVPVAEFSRAPKVSVTDSAAKTVVAPLGDVLRVAGGAVVGGPVPPGFEAAMLDHVDALYPGAARLERATGWTGLRPCTPDGRPIVERGAPPGLYLNCGHGGLGWTLAWGTAHRIAEMVSGDA